MNELERKFFDKKSEYIELFESGKVEEAFKMMKEVKAMFEEPIIQEGLYYLLVEDFINMCIKTEKYELANKYLSLLFVAGGTRADYGDKEFIAGELAYAQGEMELAKELFYISNFKSEGDLLRGKENKKYRELIRGM